METTPGAVRSREKGRAALANRLRGLNARRWDQQRQGRLEDKSALHRDGRPNRKEVNRMLSQTNPRGQGLVEYALILVLVAVVVILILGILGNAVGNVFSNILSWI
jgi:pilus assembly protein Flp/PilA